MHRLRWQSADQIIRSQIPEVIRGWLLDPTSLTHRMKQACPKGFRVRLLDQEWARPRRDEAKILRLRPAMRSLIRQVQLLCDETPCVFARTVIPISTLTGKQRRLARLGSRPLGAFLFKDQTLRRGQVEICCIRPGHELFLHAAFGITRPSTEIWGRRSVFFLNNKPLLVNEIFLAPPKPCCKRRPYTI